jgi:anaerobic selenocysteine-containing dehydrogenase
MQLIAHRQLGTMNSQLRELEETSVLVHPSIAANLGGDGAGVEVRGAHGSITGVVRSDDRLGCDAVAIPHGWPAPNVSALTSADRDIDPLTGMVRQSAIAVVIQPLASRASA